MTHDDYTRALDTLYRSVDTSHRANPELNLQRTRALLAALGAPEQHIRCVIVAGTKGKGSTAAMIERIARAAGMRTGLWTSPHLHTYRERIQVDGQPIAAAQLIADIDAIMPLADAVARATGGMPATFAIGFALALQHFARSGVGLAVIEVGLGGTYDSAAVLEPECAVIASISYDHMEILGDTLDAIARQKAGIMRRGRPAVTVAQLPGALAALIDEAQRIGAPLTLVADPASDRAVPHDLPPTVRVVMPDPLVDAPLGLAGSFQRENAGLALAAVRQLQALGWCIRAPTVCDFLHVLVERERCAGFLPPHVLQQLQQVAHSCPSASRTFFAVRITRLFVFLADHPLSSLCSTPSNTASGSFTPPTRCAFFPAKLLLLLGGKACCCGTSRGGAVPILRRRWLPGQACARRCLPPPWQRPRCICVACDVWRVTCGV